MNDKMVDFLKSTVLLGNYSLNEKI